jgi:hypothetical protein
VRLALRLCVERELGRGSEYAAAIAALPDVVDLPVMWTQGEVEQLQCPHMIHLVGALVSLPHKLTLLLQRHQVLM